MDAFLDYLGLYRSDVAKDGSCLFRVVSEQLFYTQVHHVKLREGCVEYMERNRAIFESLVNQDFAEYLEKIRDETEWVGEVEMKALSLKYKLDFVIYHDVTKPPLNIKASGSVQTISLACTGGNRYDCVYSKSELSSLAFCQSIVYEVLYQRVYELGSDVDIAVSKMLHDKAYSKQRRNNLLCHYFRESCRIESVIEDPNLPEDDQAFKSSQNPRLEIRKALAQGVPPFPYKVAKTLDPNIYRNVEFDMWNEKRKEEQKSEQFVVPKLEPGVKCKVHINKDIYIGHVQDIFNDSENVSIYIEELCKRCVVSSSVLEVVPVPAYKALTWQGGKTYKVYSDCVQTGSDVEKTKYKRSHKKNYQDQSPTHNAGNNCLKPNIIARSNSLPTSTNQRNSFLRSNNMCSPQFNRKKGHSTSTPVNYKQKNQGPRESRSVLPILPPQTYPCIWNGMTNLPTPPIPIPGKVAADCFPLQTGSPELLSELNDSGWTEDSFKHLTPANFSPSHQYALTPAYSDTGYSPMVPNSSFAVVSNATSLPLAIPGSQTGSPPPGSEDAATSPMQPAQCPATSMALYPYPVYAVPGMYLVCRDGSTLPMNIPNPWGSQEPGSGTEVPNGVPSVYFNTPPMGMSPPMTSWIPASLANYGSSWSPGMPPAVAFTPPMEVNANQYLLSPPWSPQSGIYLPQPVAYQVQQGQQSHVAPQEPTQN